MNNSANRVQVTKADSSCDCLTVALPKHPILAGERAEFEIVLDLGSAPHFKGGLEIDVTGFDSHGIVVLHLKVRAEVRAQAEKLERG
ncbi:MAG: DUF1573 domain-containing protein [Acidobacteriales bacterium]|nr:DUF1573 domain-containing protein [Terriglobales bacterium]